jgi:hypothetical protein
MSNTNQQIVLDTHPDNFIKLQDLKIGQKFDFYDYYFRDNKHVLNIPHVGDLFKIIKVEKLSPNEFENTRIKIDYDGVHFNKFKGSFIATNYNKTNYDDYAMSIISGKYCWLYTPTENSGGTKKRKVSNKTSKKTIEGKKKVPKKVTKKVPKKVTKKVPKKVPKKVTKKVPKKVTKKVPKK